MKSILKKIIPKEIKQKIRAYRKKRNVLSDSVEDTKKFIEYSFSLEGNSDSFEQLEARLTKTYHSLEKGLSYSDIRLGFGKKNIDLLLNLLDIYTIKGYDTSEECYLTALDNLKKYIKLHEEHDYDINELKEKVNKYYFVENDFGGVLYLNKNDILNDSRGDFKQFSSSRHSVRSFSEKSVEIDKILDAINLAQLTPSACNRQSWKVRVIKDEKIKKIIEQNQNGNKGFGHNIDKFILVTTNSQYYSKERERNQLYIDGGLYAMNLLYALHYYGIATVSLSAALTNQQNSRVRNKLKIPETENLIMFIGIGNYVEEFKVPKSTRRQPLYEVY